MQTQKKEKFTIVGIKTRTQNDGNAGTDIPALWNRFMKENIGSQISNKAEEAIYCLYSNYEGDHLAPYDCILGYKVNSTENIPEGMIIHEVEATETAKFTAKGSIVKGEAVVNTWFQIWKSELNRSYTTDYEVYDERSRDLNNAEVDIFIAVR